MVSKLIATALLSSATLVANAGSPISWGPTESKGSAMLLPSRALTLPHAWSSALPDFSLWPKGHHHHGDPGPVAAPEIDPAGTLSGLGLLVGGLAVLRGRRRKD